MIEQGLTTLLSNNPQLQTLIGTCLYPVLVPEQTTYPCLSYQAVSASSDYALEGSSERWKRLQFDAWGQAYADCKNVMAALDAALDGLTGALPDGTVVLGAFRGGVELDLSEPYSRTFRTMVEYTFHYRTP